MTLHHYRVRDLVPGSNTDVIYTPLPKMLAHQRRPRLNTDTLIRTWGSLEFSVMVLADNPPVQFWWYDTYVTMTIAWSPNDTTVMPSPNDSTDHTIATVQLVPRVDRFELPETGYRVVWTTPEQVDVKTMRSGNSADTGPSVNLGVLVYDPNDALNQQIDTYSVAINWMAWLHTLWGSESPV
jgi:hypothetical protein